MLPHLAGQHPWDAPGVQVGRDPTGLDGHQVTTNSYTGEGKTEDRLTEKVVNEQIYEWRSDIRERKHFNLLVATSNETSRFIVCSKNSPTYVRQDLLILKLFTVPCGKK